MKIIKSAAVLSVTLLMSTPYTASGAVETLDSDVSKFRPHVGAVFGSLAPSSRVGDASVHFGVDIGFSPVDQFGLGITLSYYSSEDQTANSSIDTQLVPLLIETSYHFSKSSPGKFLDGFHLGTKQGFVFRESTIRPSGQPTRETDTTGFGIGPLFGYDHVIGDRLTIGGELNYLFVLDDDDYQVFNMLAAVKYWL